MSMNHGIFLCSNCAIGIHMEYYPVEVSCVKAIHTDHFNYLQLRVLINGGNDAAYNFFEVYDLVNEPVQKRYNTVAAQVYRDKLKAMLENSFIGSSREAALPSFEDGRQAM